MQRLNLSHFPQPKDFSSFEEFEKATMIYETLKSRTNQLNALIIQKLPQETFDEEMNKLGFFKNTLKDMFGENAYIVKFILDFQKFQDFCLEDCFYNLRPKDEVCLTFDMLDDPLEIPESWLKLNSLENQIINHSINFLSNLKNNKSNKIPFKALVKEEKFLHFGRIWFEWMFENLILKVHHPELSQELIKFLEMSPFIQVSKETQIFKMFLKNLKHKDLLED